MPILVDAETRRMSQNEFGAVAYQVMRRVFDVHNQLGRFFNESIYQKAVADGLSGARTEVKVEAVFEDFRKQYFIDLLVDGGAAFEFKAVEKLTGRHRAQLLNYLLLAELSHGKLINVRPELVEHEFVNTSLTREVRAEFATDDSEWREMPAVRGSVKEYLLAVMRDWGTGLEIPLYTDALTHFLGGEATVQQEVAILLEGRQVGRQKIRLLTPDATFQLTQIADKKGLDRFETHARLFLNHTGLNILQWINISLHQVTFRTIRRDKA